MILMREIIGEARDACVPIKIRVLKNSRSFEFVSRLGFDEPLDFGRHVELTWTPPQAAADPDAKGDGFTRRGARVRVQLGEIDEITLDVHGTVIERLDVEDEPLVAEEETDDEPAAGPITIAVDVTEAQSDNPVP